MRLKAAQPTVVGQKQKTLISSGKISVFLGRIIALRNDPKNGAGGESNPLIFAVFRYASGGAHRNAHRSFAGRSPDGHCRSMA